MSSRNAATAAHGWLRVALRRRGLSPRLWRSTQPGSHNMRVLSVSALIDPASGGGTAERTAQLARAMSRVGMDVTVLATDAGLAAGRAVDVGRARLELVP